MGTEHSFINADSLPNSSKQIYKTLSAPVTAQWELTDWCNQRCFHCYNYWRKDSSLKPSFDPAELTLYGKVVSELVGNRVFHVTITGGEPLIALERAYPYLQEVRDQKVGISLNSNLTLLSPKKMKLLEDLQVRSVLTSLMTRDPELNDRLANKEGAHKAVTQGIRMLTNEGFVVSVNMVVTKANLREIFSTAEYVQGLGVRSFSATRASTPVRDFNFSNYALSLSESKIMMGELLRVKGQLGLKVDTLVASPLCLLDTPELNDTFGARVCSAGKINCTIGFDGSIRPCSQLDNVYGNVNLVDGLADAWSNMNLWRTDAFIPDICLQCAVGGRCYGGCRAEAYAVSGSLKTLHPLCTNSISLLSSPVFQEEEQGISDDPQTQYIFNKSVRVRKEEFGGILFLSPAKWVPINHEMYQFKMTTDNNPFTLDSLAVVLKIDVVGVMPTAKMLLKKGIIIERR